MLDDMARSCPEHTLPVLCDISQTESFDNALITSVGGLQPTPIAPSYSASKAFQINYTKSLQDYTIRVKTKHYEIFVS